MSILDDLAITTVTKTAKVSADQLRGKLGLPADSIVQIVAADDGSPLLLCSWLATEAPAAPEKPAPKSKKKPEEPVVAPPPVEVDWTGALNERGESK